MPNYTGTSGNDTIVATHEAGYAWGDQVLGEGGNDAVTLSPGVTFVSGPGDDTITGLQGGSYAAWSAPGAVVVNLAQGWAQDGYGGTDSLSGINEIHLPGRGGTVTGTGNAETVFFFGGDGTLDLAGGSDVVRMWGLDSSAYTVRQFGSTVRITSPGHEVEVRNVESLEFSDRTLDTTHRTGPYFDFRYDVFSFTESEWSQGWWYAGVYSPPQLVSYFPQAVGPVDIGGDGDADLLIPLNRGYRTGVDTRYHFQALENVDGRLVHSGAMTEATPFIAGSRRTETIHLHRYGSEAMVTVAHDTAIETETRNDLPWRYGDVSLLLLDPFADVTAALVPDGVLPKAEVTGRDTAVDAHSLGVGDVNGDGMEDILVGDFSGPFLLLQTAAGPFTYHTDDFLQSLAFDWREPTVANPSYLVLCDLHLADLDGDGVEDIVAGWGHGPARSRVFFNDGHGSFSVADSLALPVSAYGIDNTIHLKTFAEDFDRDGDTDLVILQSRYEPYYGGNYLQFLENDGTGNFADATSARFGDPASFEDTFGARLEWTDFWQVLDVDGDGALDIAGHLVGGDTDGMPIVYHNDGTGHFDRVDLALQGGRPVAWADYDGDGLVEVVTFASTWNDAQGTSSTNTFSVYEWKSTHPAHAIAYDLEGNAGIVARILGAVFGPAAVDNPTFAGIGLSLADGGMGYDALLDLALDARLGATRTDDSVVDVLYTNVVGAPPPPAVHDSFVSLITGGQFTQVSLARMAADHELNLARIDFVGLTQGGLEYLPLG